MKIIKRNGSEVEFDKTKIINAISKANNEVEIIHQLSSAQINAIADIIEKDCKDSNRIYNVENIQDKVENYIMEMRGYEVARAYVKYRYKRSLSRIANTTDDAILTLLDNNNEEIKQENSNKNPTILSVQRDYIAGESNKDIWKRIIASKEIVEAHEKGIIHWHDTDYTAMRMHNCCLINLEDMLQNGTVISGTMIETPKSFLTACNITTQIVAQVASSQYGGQSFTLSHLAPFVNVSRVKIRKQVIEEREDVGDDIDLAKIEKIVEKRLSREIKAGIQLIQYQLVTLMTTNGQTPFITIFMYINEVPEGQIRDDLVLIIKEMLSQRIIGLKNEKGVYITPAFPKLIYALDENNAYENTEYWEVTKLAAKCTAKRMVPDYISAKIMKELKNGNVYPSMGCRSFLTPDRFTKDLGNISNALNYNNNKGKYYGRFNQGVVTINLPHVALSSNRDEEKFWKFFDERLELCHKALKLRHQRLVGTKSDVAPILWQYGALARLKKGETIDKLLYNGYSTISLGYAGLYECTKYMTGSSHTGDGKNFALKVMQKLNDKCEEWKKEENIDYSVYGTPLESTTYKFAKANQDAFGIIKGVTDKNYITNSYHVHVTESIDAFSKLKFESEFQKLSPGGAISYVEVPNLQNNVDAVLSVMQYIYENIMYAELNTKSDYCHCCGFDGEIKIVTDKDGKLVWECPNCKNRNQNMMSVARRTCGYIGTQFWNQGRTQEIKDRILHL